MVSTYGRWTKRKIKWYATESEDGQDEKIRNISN